MEADYVKAEIFIKRKRIKLEKRSEDSNTTEGKS